MREYQKPHAPGRLSVFRPPSVILDSMWDSEETASDSESDVMLKTQTLTGHLLSSLHTRQEANMNTRRTQHVSLIRGLLGITPVMKYKETIFERHKSLYIEGYK